jgi:hypothetical protein
MTTQIKTESVEEYLARGGKIQKTFWKEHARRKIYWKGDDLREWNKDTHEASIDTALEGATYAGDLVATWRG